MTIVFMGTPQFAVPCLERLIEDNYTISAVISQPDRPRGRGHKLQPTPVKKVALAHDIPVFQPKSMREPEAIAQLRELAPDLLVVVAYGQILSKEVLEIPTMGAVNIHASLLPKYRGAAPIQWAILNGEKETGITSMLLDEGMDTGDILLQDPTPINAGETSGELFERLSYRGADTLSRTVKGLVDGTITPIPQDHSQATYAPMLDREMGDLDFSKEPEDICCQICGLNPWPKALTMLDGERISVLEAEPAEGYAGTPGEVLDPKELIIGCGSGAVRLITVQPQGRAAMRGADFANGRRLEGGEIFTLD